MLHQKSVCKVSLKSIKAFGCHQGHTDQHTHSKDNKILTPKKDNIAFFTCPSNQVEEQMFSFMNQHTHAIIHSETAERES